MCRCVRAHLCGGVKNAEKVRAERQDGAGGIGIFKTKGRRTREKGQKSGKSESINVKSCCSRKESGRTREGKWI